MTYKCPGCQKEVDRGSTVCGNPECRKDLAFCSHCRDVGTYTLLEKGVGRFARDIYRCERCLKTGMKCLTWAAGGYCNGLARANERGGGRFLCAACHERVGETGRSVISWTLIGALGGLIRPRK